MDIILNDNIPSEPGYKRRWGMAGTEPLKSVAEVMPHRSANNQELCTCATYSFD